MVVPSPNPQHSIHRLQEKTALRKRYNVISIKIGIARGYNVISPGHKRLIRFLLHNLRDDPTISLISKSLLQSDTEQRSFYKKVTRYKVISRVGKRMIVLSANIQQDLDHYYG